MLFCETYSRLIDSKCVVCNNKNAEDSCPRTKNKEVNGMTLKKKISIAVSGVCIIILVVAAVLCVHICSEPDAPDIIEAPFEKLYWGMTLEEAEQVLKEAGIDKVLKASVSDPLRWDVEIWTLTIEQAEILGFKHIEGLDLSTKKYWPVHVGFKSPSKDEEIRLVTVSVVVEVDAAIAAAEPEKIDYVRQQISPIFGDPVNERQTHWIITDDPDPRASSDPTFGILEKAVGVNELLLRYNGSLYVTALYGSHYGFAETDRYM